MSSPSAPSDSLPIGLFDSGAGGLFVLNHLREKFPKQDFIYMADTANFPYGEKTQKEIVNLALQCASTLKNRGCETIIMACNTAASYATHALQENFSGAILEPISAAVEDAKNSTKNGRIGLLATKATIRSGLYQKLLANYELDLYVQESPLLAYFVQEGDVTDGKLQEALKLYLNPLLEKQIDTLILGCTHYPYVEPLLKTYNLNIIDSSKSFVQNLILPNAGNGHVEFIVTGDRARFEETIPLYTLFQSDLLLM